MIGITWIICCGIITVSAMLVAVDMLKTYIKQKKRERQYKHRFDKLPMAACYCKDCVYHMENQRICGKSRNWKSTRDDWFCADAIPKKTE